MARDGGQERERGSRVERRRLLKIIAAGSAISITGLSSIGLIREEWAGARTSGNSSETPRSNGAEEGLDYGDEFGAPPEPLETWEATVGGIDVRIDTMAEGLEIPWDIDFSPDGRIFFTERVGRVRVIGPEGLLDRSYSRPPSINASATDPGEEPVWWVKGGEGGLLGLALHPAFPDEPYIYVYYTYDDDGETKNRVSRIEETALHGGEEEVLLQDIPGGGYHDGGRIEFGPDGNLYVLTGEGGEEDIAPDTESLGGKVLRMTPEGEPAPRNPFHGEGENAAYVYSYGHRNPQGIAFRDGLIYATEHGPSGHDELNLLRRGGDFGWPEHTGSSEGAGTLAPIHESGTDTWAPSGATFYTGPVEEWQGSLFFAGLVSESLFRARVQGTEVQEFERLLEGQFGRLRCAAQGPDGGLYLLTSNRDGRHVAAPSDDRVLRIRPAPD